MDVRWTKKVAEIMSLLVAQNTVIYFFIDITIIMNENRIILKILKQN